MNPCPLWNPKQWKASGFGPYGIPAPSHSTLDTSLQPQKTVYSRMQTLTDLRPWVKKKTREKYHNNFSLPFPPPQQSHAIPPTDWAQPEAEATGQESLSALPGDQSSGQKQGREGKICMCPGRGSQLGNNQHIELQANLSPRAAMNQKSFLAKHHSYPPRSWIFFWHSSSVCEFQYPRSQSK